MKDGMESRAAHAFLHPPRRVTDLRAPPGRVSCLPRVLGRAACCALGDTHECGPCLQPLLFTASGAGIAPRASRLVQALGACPRGCLAWGGPRTSAQASGGHGGGPGVGVRRRRRGAQAVGGAQAVLF